MEEIGREAINSLGNYSNMKFGFHVPPFTSVDHLHLHCMAGEFKFTTDITHSPQFFWFASPESIISRLSKMNSKTPLL